MSSCFEMLKEPIIISPILKYPDPKKGYTLFTDASKYAWATNMKRMEKNTRSTILLLLLVDYSKEVK